MEESPKLQVDRMNSSKMHPTKKTNSKKNTPEGIFSKHDHDWHEKESFQNIKQVLNFGMIFGNI